MDRKIDIRHFLSPFGLIQVDNPDMHIIKLLIHLLLHIQMVPVGNTIFKGYPQKKVQQSSIVIRDRNIKTSFHRADIQAALSTVHHFPNEKVALVIIEKMLLE